MKKKQPKKPRKPPSRRASAQPPAEPPIPLPDRRAMEGIMHGLLGGLTRSRGNSPLDQAQELIYSAFETPDPGERAALARRALELSPDCADSYVLLAEQAGSRKEALELYQQAVDAGERALGPEVFREHAGHFWGLLDTRPYMRAREGLAHLLWTYGRRDEAIAHLQEMLRLNPNDNQGLRYILAGWLLSEGRDDELNRLLDQYDEPSANWAFNRALAAFRRKGDTPEARDLLRKAKATNKHVLPYLLGQKRMPPDPPEMYSPGSVEEAILYAGETLSGWKTTPGALAWLKGGPPGEKEASRTEDWKPLPLEKQRLARLPQSADTWQADFRLFDIRLEEHGELIRPWLILIVSRTSGLILAQEIATVEPDAEALWDLLAKALQKPTAGKRHRPTTLEVRPDGRWEALAPHLQELGIEVLPTERLDLVNALMAELNRQFAADQPPGLLEATGVTPERLAGFYRAAAAFYRQALWRKLGYEATIRVACDRFPGGPWYAVVMGQSGMTFGVALYDDLDVLRKLFAGELTDEENASETVALALTYEEAADLPDGDLDAIEVHGFEVAGPSAYPAVYRKEQGMSMRPPLDWELDLMEGCLRAIPEFVARHTPGDTAPHPVTVPAGSGNLDLVLAWVSEDT